MFFLQLFVIIVLLYICAYLLGKYNEYYWKKRGIPFYSKNKVTGVYWDFVFNDRPIFAALSDVYKAHPEEDTIGIGFFLTPTLYVKNPRNVQHILSTNFANFNHRAVEANNGDLLADNVLFMYGKRWKLMRQKLTPLFTSMKLRNMYYIIDKSAIDFASYLKENPKLLKGDAYNTISTFCCAAIGAAVFGICPASIFQSPFLDMAQQAFKPSFWNNTNLILSNISLDLSRLIGIKIFKEHEKLFIGAIKQVIEQRKRDKVKKHDFADLCVSLQQNGIIVDEQFDCKLEPTDELLAAQAFFFFIAGVEPTASALFGTLFELGKHPAYLEKLHKEIDETYTKCQGHLTADIVGEMRILDMVICEAMRLHPPVGYLKRLCVQDTVLPEGNLKIKKGTRIYTPVYDIHHDARYYPNPEKFDPERFSPESKQNLDEFLYMPFGRGFRVCIGMRYALLQVKAGLVHLLRHFTVISHENPPGLRYSKQQLQVRLDNVDVEFIARKYGYVPKINA